MHGWEGGRDEGMDGYNLCPCVYVWMCVCLLVVLCCGSNFICWVTDVHWLPLSLALLHELSIPFHFPYTLSSFPSHTSPSILSLHLTSLLPVLKSLLNLFSPSLNICSIPLSPSSPALPHLTSLLLPHLLFWSRGYLYVVYGTFSILDITNSSKH